MTVFIQSFPGSNFVQFRISSMLYMYKETPDTILLVKFGLFGEKFVTSFVYPEIKRQR